MGYGEQAKGSQITKIFEDAYKSPFSIVILVRLGFVLGPLLGWAHTQSHWLGNILELLVSCCCIWQ